MEFLVDLDGTVAHFGAKFHRLRLELFPDLNGIPHPDQQFSFNMWEGRSEEEQNAIRTLMNYPGFYADLEPMDDVVEAVAEMEAAGHQVDFLSAPWTTNPTCAQDKYDWVARHFGERYRDKLFLVKKKHRVTGDILFDDKYPIEDAEKATWTQVFITQPYNAAISGYRVNSIAEWEGVVRTIQYDRLTSFGRPLREEVSV